MLTEEQSAQLEASTPAEIEAFIHGVDSEVQELIRTKRATMIAAHQILDRKNVEVWKAHRAARPANYPPDQTIGPA